MAITGIFSAATPVIPKISQNDSKQLGKDVADVHDIAKSSKEDLEAYDILLLGIPTGITAKRSVTGMTSSRLSKRLISMANWLRCLVVVTGRRLRRIFLRRIGHHPRHH